MLLPLFLVLLGLSLFFVILGYWVSESAYSIIGFIFLFVLSTTILLPGTLQQASGVNETTTYTYGANLSLSSTTMNSVDNVVSFPVSSQRWFGLWLAIISIIGEFISIVELRYTRRPEDE